MSCRDNPGFQVCKLLASCTNAREASGFYDYRCTLILQICSEKEIQIHGLHRVDLGASRGWPYGPIIDVSRRIFASRDPGTSHGHDLSALGAYI